MRVLFQARIISSFSLAFAVLNFVLMLMGHISKNNLAFLWIILFTSVIHLLKSKNRRLVLLSFPFTLIPYLSVKSIYDAVFITVINLYSFYLVFRVMDRVNYSQTSDEFNKGIGILASIFLFCLIIGRISILSSVSAPYIIIYLISSVLLLRILRYVEYNSINKKINEINLRYTIVITAAAMIISTDGIRHQIFVYLYKTYCIIIDVFMFLFSWAFLALGYILGFLINIVKRILEGRTLYNVNINSPGSPFEGLKFSDRESIVSFIISNKLINITFRVLVFALIIYILFKVFKRQSSINRKNEFYSESREYIKFEKSSAKSLIKRLSTMRKPRDYTELIRFYYTKFLRKCTQAKIDIKESDTTFEICEKAKKNFNNIAADAMRNIYIKIRYGGSTADKKTADEFYKYYREIKPNPKQ